MSSAPALLPAAALATALLVAGQALADPGVRVEHAAARLVVIPEARADVAVTVTPGDPRLPALAVRREGSTVVLDGGLRGRIGACRGADLNVNGRLPLITVDVRGVGRVPFDRLPVVTARVPLATQVAGGEAVWGEVGPSRRLTLSNAGCGDWRVAPVREALTAQDDGSGDVHAQTAGELGWSSHGSGDLTLGAVAGPAVLQMAGSGDVRLEHVSGRLEARLAGSGDVVAGRVDGPVQASIAGSGDVHIAAGRVPAVQVETAGSGDFVFNGEAGSLSARTAGSGDIHVARVTGPVSRASAGSGEITVGGR